MDANEFVENFSGVEDTTTSGDVYISPEARVIGSTLEGTIYIGAGCVVENSTIRGAVTIAATDSLCMVMSSTIQGPAVVIGSSMIGTEIMDGCELWNCTIDESSYDEYIRKNDEVIYNNNLIRVKKRRGINIIELNGV